MDISVSPPAASCPRLVVEYEGDPRPDDGADASYAFEDSGGGGDRISSSNESRCVELPPMERGKVGGSVSLNRS